MKAAPARSRGGCDDFGTRECSITLLAAVRRPCVAVRESAGRVTQGCEQWTLETFDTLSRLAGRDADLE